MIRMKNCLAYKIIREIKIWFVRIFLKSFKELARSIRNVAEVHYMDKKLNIDTVIGTSRHFGAKMPNDYRVYEPTPYVEIKELLAGLELCPNDVFLDLGCGKGRVVCSVAAKKIKKVIGLEIQEDLAKIATQNLAKLTLKNTPVEIIVSDVVNFDMREATVIYMYWPFGNNTAAIIRRNIKDSLKVNPRKLQIVVCCGPDLFTSEDFDWLACENKNNLTFWRTKM